MPEPRGGVLKHGTRNAYERHKCRCDECRAQNAERHHQWVVENRERSREIANASYARHREKWHADKIAKKDERLEKRRANRAVQYAVSRGWLVPGECERAGADCSGPVQAHHDDYSKPLEVRWLCASHHRREHLARQG